MTTNNYITKDGLDKLTKELNYLIDKERPAISKQIAEARSQGDLSENAEYDAAKEAQGLLELKISKLKNIISNSRVLDASKIKTNKVQLLNKVKVKNLANNKIAEYTIVAEAEANLKELKISIESPIAKGLLGKKKGDKVRIDIPSGQIELEIIDISV